MWAGLGFTVIRAVLKRTRPDILLLAWFLPFFLITGLAEVKFLRYLLPVTPFLAIMAANLSDKTLTRLRSLSFKPNVLYGGGIAAVALIAFATVFYSFAYANIYLPPTPPPAPRSTSGRTFPWTPFSPWSTGRRAAQSPLVSARHPPAI